MSVDLHAIGAFLSGAAAVIGAMYTVKAMRKKAEADCDKRIEEVKKAMHEGFEMHE